ncbi:MAG: response regulator transcription factor [Phycisphaerae bacterium]|nr:response regulator transcription factor [Phycisphaerae bacterium]
MAKGNILIIEDDHDIVDLLAFNLQEEDYETHEAFDGREGLALAGRLQPDLVILDIMLPEMDGFEVCRELKADKSTMHIPIIMLSARSQETDKVVGLELGADDYVTKPFSPRELIARVRAILRRHRPIEDTPEILHGLLTLDSVKHKVTIDGQTVDLTSTEFKLLACMAGKPGQVLSRDRILNAISDDEAMVCDRTVDAHIKSLRRKLGLCKDYIETVRGIGYRFKEVV